MQAEEEVKAWTSRAAAGVGVSPSADAQLLRWCHEVGLDGRSIGLHADTLRSLHYWGLTADLDLQPCQ